MRLPHLSRRLLARTGRKHPRAWRDSGDESAADWCDGLRIDGAGDDASRARDSGGGGNCDWCECGAGSCFYDVFLFEPFFSFSALGSTPLRLFRLDFCVSLYGGVSSDSAAEPFYAFVERSSTAAHAVDEPCGFCASVSGSPSRPPFFVCRQSRRRSVSRSVSGYAAFYGVED